MMIDKVNLAEKLNLFDDYWSPKVVGAIGDYYIKLVKFKGEFVWHSHEIEDELFFVLKGSFVMRLRDRDVEVKEGEIIVVPSGVEHMPCADEEVHVLLFEPKTTLNTGNVKNDRIISRIVQL